MAKKKTTILGQLSNLKAIELETLQAVQKQRDDQRITDQPDAARLVDRIESTLAAQTDRLDQRISALGGDDLGALKERLAQALGMIEGFWQNLRDEPVSSALRDDYVALNLAAIHCTTLHSVALALDDRTSADLAFQSLRELTPLIVEISQVMPQVVVAETAQEHEGVDLAVATEAARTTHEAWQPEVAEHAPVHA